ncbi:MAG: hypothetical protein P3W91_000725 [Fervidobacterium sp.]|nr:hypothetical protein [Fervidobacterium sp.]
MLLRLAIAGTFVGVVVGFVAGWKIREDRIKLFETKLKQCEDVNIQNQKTIEELKQALEKQAKACAKRVKMKEETIKRLKEIDELKPGGNENESGSHNDTILDELNSMFGKSDDGKN